VNWLSWQELKISGVSYLVIASSSTSKQKSFAKLIDTRCASTLRVARFLCHGDKELGRTPGQFQFPLRNLTGMHVILCAQRERASSRN